MLLVSRLVFIFLLIPVFTNGQQPGHPSFHDIPAKGVFRLDALETVESAEWFDSTYLYPAFRPGFVIHDNNYSDGYELTLNYNTYFERFNFITSKGDTVPLKKAKYIKHIKVADDLFLYDKLRGYINIVSNGELCLAVKPIFRLQKAGLGGGVSLAEFLPSMDDRGVPQEYRRYYVKDQLFYFVTKSDKVYEANRATMLKLAKGNREKIRSFIEQNRLNLDTRYELTLLLEYFNTIIKGN